MIDIKKEKSILKKNKEITEAILVSQMMDSEGFKIVQRDLNRLEKKYRFQDIMGVKDDALLDQKGLVLGVLHVKDYFNRQKKIAQNPRRDPGTGEPEILNKKKGK